MPISAVLFDLDNTIYPASSGVMQGIHVRLTEYVQNLLVLEIEQAQELRKHYLGHVHDLAIESFLTSYAELDHLLSELTATKAIFTNSPAEYARRVLRAMGIERHFEHVFDIRFSGFRPKPDPIVYQSVLDALGVTGAQAILVED